MKETLEGTGVLSLDELMRAPGMPTEGRMGEGPVAIIECTQEIPCDPCVDACPHGAIEMAGGITGLPQLLGERCTGCGVCIAQCPGQAIFVVHVDYGPEWALLMIPYEFHPLPRVHARVSLLDREGRVVGEGEVLKVRNPRKNDRTPVISLRVPRGLIMGVRNICF
jgi:Fe-S-cluster-containing hydrogenase component 2